MNEKVLAECISEALIKSKLHLVEHDMLKEYIKAYEENKHLKDLQKNMDKQYAELESVLDEISEKLDFAKATIEHDKDYDIGYNFLISAEKIKRILDKVKNDSNV